MRRATLPTKPSHPHLLPRRPQGQGTRGKTARNRLRRVDNLVMLYDEPLLRRASRDYTQEFFVDLGYGAEPYTTLESAARFRRLNPNLGVLGVEIEPARVAAALPYADAQTHFRLGGFNLPLQTNERVRLVRAFNVLRQYEESAVAEAYAMLARAVVPGGLLVEGTSDPFGRLFVTHLWRRGDAHPWLHEAIVFSTNFWQPIAPADFQAVLPKDLIHRVVPGEPIFDFFREWKQAMLATIGQQSWGMRQWFAAGAVHLAAQGYNIDTRRRWLNRGYLIWQRPALL